VADTQAPECRPDEVEISVEWRDDDGALTGEIVIGNVSGSACRISGKPALLPLADDGTPIGVFTIVTAELRLPGYVVLPPGRRARSGIRWKAWRGRPPGNQALVRWPGGEQRVTVTGPVAPRRRRGPTNISSAWFELLP
jgi:hypothetical protein